MRSLIVLVLSAWWCLPAPGADQSLAEVRKVYLMPMANGLDQYLAGQLTREGVFTVVVDPQQAEAVLTDRVDAGFAAAMDDLYPPPKPESPPAAETLASDTTPAPYRRAIGRARGNVFLVGVASRQVIWSTFLNLDDIAPRALHRAARDIVRDLQRDLKK